MTEYRVIMTVIVVRCGTGVAYSVSPAFAFVADVVFGVLFGLGGLVVAGYVGREVRRALLFRAEMRELDRRDAARAVLVGTRR